MFSQPNSLTINIPQWLTHYCEQYKKTKDIHQRMQFVVNAARLNVEHKTGGPFAAGIFEVESGELISLGTNLVFTEKLSTLHAEIVAISLAQKKLGTYDLGDKNLKPHELVTSTEPCAMCFGAIPWSGVKRVICGAKDEDARSIGFDEGAKSSSWIKDLQSRQIDVITEIEREEAAAVLRYYAAVEGHIYNSREN